MLPKGVEAKQVHYGGQLLVVTDQVAAAITAAAPVVARLAGSRVVVG